MNFEDLEFLWGGNSKKISRVTKNEGFLIYNTVKSLKTGVEIGRLCGGTTLLIASAISKDGLFISIDNHTSQKPIVHNVFDSYLDKLLHIYNLNAKLEVANSYEFPNKELSLDFIFIDGDHSYEGVSKDLEHWFPVIKKNGKVLFHDTNLSGVKKAIKEFSSKMTKIKKEETTELWIKQ